MRATRNRAFPYENDEFDILVGTRDEDGRSDDDDTTMAFDDKNEASTSSASISRAGTATTSSLEAATMIPSKAARA